MVAIIYFLMLTRTCSLQKDPVDLYRRINGLRLCAVGGARDSWHADGLRFIELAEPQLRELADRHGVRQVDIEPVSAGVIRQWFLCSISAKRRRDEEV